MKLTEKEWIEYITLKLKLDPNETEHETLDECLCEILEQELCF
jgi:hypothetical protein